MKARDQSGSPLEFASGYHAPVLCHAVVEGLVTKSDGLYVDATLGGGGHTAALLEALSPRARVVGVDRDPEAIVAAAKRLEKPLRQERLTVLRSNFAELESRLVDLRFAPVDGILLDLGVSSHQLDDPERGFSHREDGPLDMRMEPDEPLSAGSLVNESKPDELVRILFEYGEESSARRIVRAIEKARPIATTGKLADVIRSQARGFGPDRTRAEHKMLARVFQAIRIAVNQELDALESVLPTATELVRPGGRLVVISYHSLEDRRVKRFMRTGNVQGTDHRDLYGNRLSPWKEHTRKPIIPDDEEQKANPRSRSARLRIAERLHDSSQGKTA